jgi:uncharacterized repeat protein (TIGR01451 family)
MKQSRKVMLLGAAIAFMVMLLLTGTGLAQLGTHSRLTTSRIGGAATTGPTVDLAILSKTANVSRAHPGQQVTFTIVAANLGPDTAPSLDVTDLVDFQPSRLQLVDESCDEGVSPDTPSCEYTDVASGETVTTTVTVRVLKHLKHSKLKVATNEACASSEQEVIDTNSANDCLTVTLPLTGPKRF